MIFCFYHPAKPLFCINSSFRKPSLSRLRRQLPWEGRRGAMYGVWQSYGRQNLGQIALCAICEAPRTTLGHSKSPMRRLGSKAKKENICFYSSSRASKMRDLSRGATSRTRMCATYRPQGDLYSSRASQMRDLSRGATSRTAGATSRDYTRSVWERPAQRTAITFDPKKTT